MQTLHPSGRHPIGPVVRVLAGALLGVLAVLLALRIPAVFKAASITASTCAGRRSTLCELSNLALSLTPRPLQGPLNAIVAVAFIALLAWLVWWLLRPLLFKRYR